MMGTTRNTARRRMILSASVPVKELSRALRSSTILVGPAITEAGIVLDRGESRVHVAEFLADALDEGAHIGAEADLAVACGKTRAVHDVVKLAIADVLPRAPDEIFDDAKFRER